MRNSDLAESQVQLEEKLRRIPERVMKNIEVRIGSCWLWTGQRDGKGYGLISFGYLRSLRAHKAVWQFIHGKQVGTEHHLRSTCKNHACVNPEHWSERAGCLKPGRKRKLSGVVHRQRQAVTLDDYMVEQKTRELEVLRLRVVKSPTLLNWIAYTERFHAIHHHRFGSKRPMPPWWVWWEEDRLNRQWGAR